jgi:thiamine biosynthesis protein ThiS
MSEPESPVVQSLNVQSLNVLVNGIARTMKLGTTVSDLLTEVGLQKDGVAVAIDMQVVPRGQHPHRKLQDGDRVEVLQAVGGG